MNRNISNENLKITNISNQNHEIAQKNIRSSPQSRLWTKIWLTLFQFFHQWRNMLKFCWVFVFVIIDCMNRRSSSFCIFYDQKREYDAILYHNMRMMHFSSGVYHISNSIMFNHTQSCVIHTNNIIFSFLTRWNSHVDTINNSKYKHLTKLQHVSSRMERLRQN